MRRCDARETGLPVSAARETRTRRRPAGSSRDDLTTGCLWSEADSELMRPAELRPMNLKEAEVENQLPAGAEAIAKGGPAFGTYARHARL